MKKKERPLRGTVVPAQTDPQGNPTVIAFQTENKKQYIIEKNRIGMELFQLMHTKIDAEGSFRERIDGNTIFRIQKYRAVGLPPEQAFSKDGNRAKNQ